MYVLEYRLCQQRSGYYNFFGSSSSEISLAVSAKKFSGKLLTLKNHRLRWEISHRHIQCLPSDYYQDQPPNSAWFDGFNTWRLDGVDGGEGSDLLGRGAALHCSDLILILAVTTGDENCALPRPSVVRDWEEDPPVLTNNYMAMRVRWHASFD